MNKDDSYLERRKLFKGIWDTALATDMDKTDEPIRNKVIKTLRLDEVSKCPIGKTKKEKIKNLRTVCNKILDFCDKQDADEKKLRQIEGSNTDITGLAHPKRKKRKHIRKKRTSQSNLFKTMNLTVGRATTSAKPGNFKSLTRPTTPNTRTIFKPTFDRFKLKADIVDAPLKKIATKKAMNSIVSGDSKKATRVVRKKRKTKKKSSAGVTGGVPLK